MSIINEVSKTVNLAGHIVITDKGVVQLGTDEEVNVPLLKVLNMLEAAKEAIAANTRVVESLNKLLDSGE